MLYSDALHPHLRRIFDENLAPGLGVGEPVVLRLSRIGGEAR